MAEEKAWTKEKIKSKIEENELDLSLSGISKVPVKNILYFPKVTVLDLSCNKINTLPENFSKLSQLVHLDLSKNSLTELPEDFGELTRLRRLDLFKNNLAELPLSFHKLKGLQWLDLKANPIQEALPKLVGDCLLPQECQRCAKNIVEHFTYLYNAEVFKERKARKLESERLAKQQREEERVRQRRKEERKRRQEERRLENQLKQSEDISQESVSDAEETEVVKGKAGSSRSCTWYFLYVLLFSLLLVGVAVVIVFKGDIAQIKAVGNMFVEKSRTYLDEITKYYFI